MSEVWSVRRFCEMLSKISRNDWYNLILISGPMGSGKSRLGEALAFETAKMNNLPYSREANMTYKREELKRMIDGVGEDKKGQLPEFSIIIVDEAISLFYKRNWNDKQQVELIELLNKCRDRHLTIIMCVPVFWDIDKAVLSHVRFWLHIKERGLAIVHEQSKNPYHIDPWLRQENLKISLDKTSQRRSPNFLFYLTWPDWDEKEKEAYYSVRNRKRVGTEGQRMTEKERERQIRTIERAADSVLKPPRMSDAERARMERIFDESTRQTRGY